MWMDYSELSQKDKLEAILMYGISRPEIAKLVGCSLAAVNRALAYHNLSTKRKNRCRICGKFSPIKGDGIGICERDGRKIGGMAYCEDFTSKNSIKG